MAEVTPKAAKKTPETSKARRPPASGGKPAQRAAAAKKAPAKNAPHVAPAAVEHTSQGAKPAKPKKPKLVRDSFTMPESEYAAIAAIKKRCLGLGVAAKKSEVLRAAISGLAGLGDEEVVAAIQGLEQIKTGRPAKGAK